MANGYAPTPSQVVVQCDSGSGDMGDVEVKFSPARFSLKSQFVLVFIRAHFDILGTGTADLKLYLDSGKGRAHDILLQTFVARGPNVDLNFKVGQDEYEKWVFAIGDSLVLVWENPDGTGALAWGVEVGLAVPE